MEAKDAINIDKNVLAGLLLYVDGKHMSDGLKIVKETI